VKLVEPPSCSSASTIVFIGKNSRGNWVAQEQNGLYGGLFVNRAQAIKYALFENGRHPETIVEVSREIELDMGGKPRLRFHTCPQFPARRMTSATAVTQESQMVQPHSVSNQEQVVDTMIELTRLSNLHRAIVAGSDSLELYLALRRRGFVRVATTETCRIPKAQHAVGLITGQNSLAAIEAALTRISPFLCTSAAVAVLIDCRESGFCLKIRAKLEQMGFRIEAGVRCQQGLVLSAYRQGFGQMENAA
jgi:hypothetical protein